MFLPGDIVRWYDTYDDIGIAKSSGLGVIISVHEFAFYETPVYLYKIYRTEKQDQVVYEQHKLELLKE